MISNIFTNKYVFFIPIFTLYLYKLIQQDGYVNNDAMVYFQQIEFFNIDDYASAIKKQTYIFYPYLIYLISSLFQIDNIYSAHLINLIFLIIIYFSYHKICDLLYDDKLLNKNFSIFFSLIILYFFINNLFGQVIREFGFLSFFFLGLIFTFKAFDNKYIHLRYFFFSYFLFFISFLFRAEGLIPILALSVFILYFYIIKNKILSINIFTILSFSVIFIFLLNQLNLFDDINRRLIFSINTLVELHDNSYFDKFLSNPSPELGSKNYYLLKYEDKFPLYFKTIPPITILLIFFHKFIVGYKLSWLFFLVPLKSEKYGSSIKRSFIYVLICFFLISILLNFFVSFALSGRYFITIYFLFNLLLVAHIDKLFFAKKNLYIIALPLIVIHILFYFTSSYKISPEKKIISILEKDILLNNNLISNNPKINFFAGSLITNKEYLENYQFEILSESYKYILIDTNLINIKKADYLDKIRRYKEIKIYENINNNNYHLYERF